jgi:GTP-binding protein
VDHYIKELLSGAWEEAPQHFVTSSSKRIGRDEVLGYIDAINLDFFEANKK